MKIEEVYQNAIKEHYAIGAFNFYNLETLQAILQTAEEERSPVIAAVSESALKYMGLETTVAMFRAMQKTITVPAFLHLDHGKNFDICKKVIDAGFDSVMIDASYLPFEENIAETKRVVDYAKPRGIAVEAELGALAGIEDDVSVSDSNAKYTNPDEAYEFVQRTGVTTLAIAIGTSHGAYKFKGESKLRIDILEQIENKLKDFPLVLHGASSVDSKITANINKYGGEVVGSKGVSEVLLKECAKHNICKINTDTDLRIANISAIRQNLVEDPKSVNPRGFLGKGRDSMKEVVRQKMRDVFNSANKF